MKLWVVYEDLQDGEMNHEYFVKEDNAWDSYNYQQECMPRLRLYIKCIETED